MTVRIRRGFLASAAVTAVLAASTPLIGGTATAGVGDTAEAGVTAGGERAGLGARGTYRLTVLHANDLESQLLGVDGDTDGDGTIDDDEVNAYGGAARHAMLWDLLRLQAMLDTFPGRGGVLSVSGGDNYLAGPEFSASLERGVPYYDALAVARLRLDASGIGNHEFDFGPDVYADFLRGLRGSLPFVSANLDVSREEALRPFAEAGELRHSTVVHRQGERIGVIGLTTPAVPTISSGRDVEVRTDRAAIANREAAALGERGVNKIILVSHLQDIDNELALVPQLRGIDAVIGAGGGEILADPGDRLIPGDTPERPYPLWATDADGNRVPVATTTGDYKYIGRLVLEFDRSGRLLRVDDERSRPVRVSGVGPDAVPRDPWTVRHVERPVAEHVDSLATTVVATSDVDLDGVRLDVRSGETNLGNLLADALRWAGEQRAEEYGVPAPIVGIQNAGGIRNDSVLPAGEITVLNTYEVAPFSNFVAVVPEVPRETLRQLLERGVAAAPEASGAFTQVSGLRFTYDVSRKAQEVDESTGERVLDVVLDDGTVVVEDGEVVDGPPIPLATNDFSARGGDAYPLAGLDFTPVGTTYQQALADYLETGLSGRITADDYPAGGEGRITRVG